MCQPVDINVKLKNYSFRLIISRQIRKQNVTLQVSMW